MFREIVDELCPLLVPSARLRTTVSRGAMLRTIGIDPGECGFLRAPAQSFAESLCGDLIALNLRWSSQLLIDLLVDDGLPDPAADILNLQRRMSELPRGPEALPRTRSTRFDFAPDVSPPERTGAPVPPGNYDQAGAPRRSVAIIGAGISGLVAAQELASCGHHVQVFEGTSRVGGRIRTHRFKDETHGELGAMRIPSCHTYTRRYIAQLGLTEAPFRNKNPDAFLAFNGQVVRASDWSALVDQKLLPSEAQGKNPLEFFEELMQGALDGLSAEALASHSTPEPIGKMATYSEMTLREFLRSKGLSDSGLSLVTQLNGMLAYIHASFGEGLIDFMNLYAEDTYYRLPAGMDQLPARLAARLESHECCQGIQLETTVEAIESSATGVLLKLCTKDGERLTRPFDYAICTVPAPQMARIEFTPSLPTDQSQAFQRISYAASAKTLFHCRHPFWQDDGIVGGGGSFLDSPIQQVWYPAYEVQPNQPCVLTASYSWEADADFLNTMSDNQRAEFVKKELERIHPGCSAHIDDYEHIHWGTEIGTGAFAYYKPGEHSLYHGPMARPFPAESPRVFFAGEHLGDSHGWIDGAVKSAWHAATELLYFSR